MSIFPSHRQRVMQNYTSEAKSINDSWGGISLKNEYIGIAGSYYRQLQTGSKGNKPIFKTGSKGLRQIDRMAAQRLAVAGYPKRKIVAQILKNSPACRGMSSSQKIGYARQLESAIHKVRCDRLMNKVTKFAYGINTNRIKNIDTYKACRFYANQAKRKGLGIGKPPSYRQFAKNPALGQNYLNRFEPNRYPKVNTPKQQRSPNRKVSQPNKQQVQTKSHHKTQSRTR